ncbi:type II secretion system protein [Roseovarius sp. 2305UL8-3]|uniref:type II secretion system protein n=1 Tax=Roseovarius conchicola TaxID=3121636 RepID=UPI0035282E40
MGTKLTSGKGPQAGFTLIELLVVIAVLAVLSVGAVLVAGRGGPEASGTADMTRFYDQFATQRALAIQGRETRGLVVQGDGLQTARLGPEGWAFSEAIQPWRGDVAFARENETFVLNAPDIRFLSNGRTSVFTIGFADGGRCEADGRAGLTCDVR